MAVTVAADPLNRHQQARVIWQLSLDAEIRVRPRALADGVIVATEHGRHTEVRRLDVERARVRWSAHLDHRAVAAPARTGQIIVVPLTNGAVVALDLDVGAPLSPPWRPVDGPIAGPIAALGGAVYVRWGTGVAARIGCFDPGAATPRWTRPDPLGGADWASFGRTAGRLLVGGDHPNEGMIVAALDADDGVTRWTHTEPHARCHHVWCLGGVVDVVTDGHVQGLDVETGAARLERFAGFPLDTARLAAGHLLALMERHDGEATLMSFASVTQALAGRVDGGGARLIGAHADEVLVATHGGHPALFTMPDLRPIALPEAEAIGPVRHVAFARDVAYLVADHGRTLTAVELDDTA